VRLVVADVDLVTSVAGSDAVGKLDSFHDAELVQDRAGLLTEDDHSLHLALHDDDVAEAIHRHAAWILQDVRAELANESAVPREYLHLQKTFQTRIQYTRKPSPKLAPSTSATFTPETVNF